MNKLTNDLLQLQELIEIRAQHQTIKPRNHLAQLNGSIEKMESQLPPEIEAMFQKLLRSTKAVVVPVHHGACTGCGMNIPVSLTQDIRSGKSIQQCSNCSRILYCPPEDMPVINATASSKYGVRQTGIAKYTAPELMLPELEARDAEAAIEELCQKLKDEGFVDDTTQLVEIAMEREAVISTAVDHGIAFPHARGVEGGGLTLALGKSERGFKFDESSDELTHLVFFIIIPTAASAFYLKLLAGLTESLQNELRRNKLLQADSPKKLWNALLQATKKTIK